MHKTEQIRELLCKELDTYADKKLDGGVLEVVDKLAHAIKNLDKIIESENGYSGARDYRRDSMGRFVGDDYHSGYSMNRNGYYSGDDTRGGYSMDYSRDMKTVKQELRDLMNDVGENTRQKLQRIVSQM